MGVAGVDVGLGQGAGRLIGLADAEHRVVVGAVNRHMEGSKGVATLWIDNADLDRVGLNVAIGQLLGGGLTVVDGVGPLPGVLIDGHVAVLAMSATDGLPLQIGVGMVDVGCRHGPGDRGRRGFVFSDVAIGLLRGRGNHRLVVGAGDGDVDLLGATVGGRDRDGVGDLLSVGERLHLRVAVVELVFPMTVGIDGEAAVGAGHAGHGHEAGAAGVRSGRGELTADGELLVFGDRTHRRAADDGLVVRAVDVDGDLLRGTVRRADGDGVGDLVGAGQPLDLGISVVERVAPLPVGVDGEAAVGALRRRHRHEADGAAISASGGQATRGSQGLIFSDRTDGGPTNGAPGHPYH